MSRENVELVRQTFEAWNAGDLDGVTSSLDAEAEFIPLRSQLDQSPYKGPEGMRRFARDADEEWEYLRLVADEIRDLGDRVLVLGRFDARGRASGMDLEFPVAWIVRFRDGKIAFIRTYSDPGEAVKAARTDD
ncbi:MAG: nuclear transport factor 2 family protein [Thermoleophilaceae bacterium]